MTQKTLHGRQRKLLMLLKAQQQVVTSKELAAQMEVSDRTVRNDVRVLNTILERYNASIRTTRGKGLVLQVEADTSPSLGDLLHAWNPLQTPEERANYLLMRLLITDGDVQLGELEDEMYVSRTTLENDIQFVRRAFTDRRPHLHLKRGGNRIGIDAAEWKKRLVLTKIHAESWDYHSREGVFLQNSPLDAEVFYLILERTKAAVKRHNIKLDDYDLVALAFTIAVAEFRIRVGHAFDAPLTMTEDAQSTAPLVRELMDELEKKLSTHFDDDERTSITLSLAFRQNPASEPENRRELLQRVDAKAIQATEMFLDKMHREYGVDFSWDETLYWDLARHIYRLEKRLRYSYERQNPMLPTIKTRFIFFFELAMTVRECFQAVYGMDISEDEWGYFSNYLIASADRAAKIQFPSGIPVAFVSHLGRSDREMLVSQFQSIYGSVVDLKGPFSIYEKEQIRDARPEMIISTVRLEEVRSELLNVPHMTMPIPLADDMYLKINWHLREIRERSFYQPLPKDPRCYFDPALFFADLPSTGEEKIIATIAQRIADLGYASTECVDRALEREEISSTAIHSGIAIPRVRMPAPSQTVIGVAALRKPVLWGRQKVSIVFLLSVSESELPLFGTLLHYLVNDLCRKENRKKLLQVRCCDDLLKLL